MRKSKLKHEYLIAKAQFMFGNPNYDLLIKRGSGETVFRGPCSVCGHRDVLDVHHVRGRRGALLCDTRYWLLVCRTCHEYIHSNPDKARARGWLANPGEWGRA